MDVIRELLGSVSVWLIWLIVVGIVAYWFLTSEQDYFKKLGIPCDSPFLIFGSAANIIFKPMHVIELERYRRNGRIFGTYEGKNPVMVVAEPELLKNILVKDFQNFNRRRNMKTGDPITDKMVQIASGEDWKRIRTIITPTFTTGKIKRMTGIFIDSSKALAENFKVAAKLGTPIECKSYFGAFTMDVIASSAFGTKVDSFNDPENVFVQTARNAFDRNKPWRTVLLILFPSVLRLFKIPVFPPNAMEFFKSVTLQIIKERREKNQTRNDFLQLLIESVNEESGEKGKKDRPKEDAIGKDEDGVKNMGDEGKNKEIFKPTYINKSLSEDELVAQCVIFFFAGFETSRSTLSFTVYELALNPTTQEKLISEIDESLKQKGEISYETICEMKYLEAVVAETLRKYPAAYRTERMCDSDYHLNGTSITIPKDMLVQIPIYAIHRDPEHYPEPEKYDPERFIGELKTSRHPYTYLPFGAGPRNCIGMRFALMQIKVCLVYLLRQFRFKKCSETKIPLRYDVAKGLVQAKDVTLKIEIRSDAVNM